MFVKLVPGFQGALVGAKTSLAHTNLVSFGTSVPLKETRMASRASSGCFPGVCSTKFQVIPRALAYGAIVGIWNCLAVWYCDTPQQQVCYLIPHYGQSNAKLPPLGKALHDAILCRVYPIPPQLLPHAPVARNRNRAQAASHSCTPPRVSTFRASRYIESHAQPFPVRLILFVTCSIVCSGEGSPKRIADMNCSLHFQRPGILNSYNHSI